MRVIFVFACIFMCSSCAYKWGYRGRALPGGYKQVAIPIFKNHTQQVGLETDFTNSMVRDFERSQVARVAGKNVAPVRIDGVIERLDVAQGAGIAGPSATSTATNPLPTDAVLVTEYILKVKVRLQVRRQSDEKVLWEGTFEDQKNYESPRIAEAILNSADATYNESIQRYTLSQLANQMMSDAHDRMTENF